MGRKSVCPSLMRRLLFSIVYVSLYLPTTDAYSQNSTVAPAALSVEAAHDASESLNAKAMSLYSAKQYDKAADAFDAALKKPAPARLTYFAAISNQYAGRLDRAKILYQFIVDKFPGTPEAKNSQAALSSGAFERQKVIAAGSADNSGVSNASTSAQTTDRHTTDRPMKEAVRTSQQSEKAVDGWTLNRTSTSNSPKAEANTNSADNAFIQVAEHTQYTEQTRAQILLALSLIPENVKSALWSGGVRVTIESDSSNMHDPGFDSAGVYMPSDNAVHVAERSSTRVLVGFVREVILHEMGHAFDQGRSGSTEFLKAYQEECDKLNPNDIKTLSYYVTTDQTAHPNKECFAEMFKVVCEQGSNQAHIGGYSSTDRVLEMRFPNTMAVVKTMVKK